MFIIVAVGAKVFPVRPVGRIVVVISVFVMHREEMFGEVSKLSGAFGTDKTVNF